MRRLAGALTGASIALLALLGGFPAIGTGSGLVDEGVVTALAAANTVTVDITEDGFDPANVTVAVGGTITWTNRTSDAHSVVGEAGSGLDSPAFERWGMYSRTFHAAGTIAYHDGLNPEQTGTINVVDGDTPPPAAERPASVDEGSAPAAAPVNAETAAPAAAQTVAIDIGSDWFGDSGFENGVYEITIQAGDTVQWTVGETVHTVYECGDDWSGANSCTDAAWNSDILSPGDTFSQQFNTAGTYAYLCTLHPLTMRGEITVQEGAAPAEPTDPPAEPTDLPVAPDSGPSASGPEASGPSSAPVAGFGPDSSGGGIDEFMPLSVLVMAAAGLTFLGSSAMLIKQRRAPAPATAVGNWLPRVRTAQDSPATAKDDVQMLQARLASLNDRFARVVRQVQLRRGGRR